MHLFDFTNIEFKIEVGEIYNSMDKSYYTYRTKNLVIMVTYSTDVEMRFKALKKGAVDTLSFIGKECVLQGDFLVESAYVKKGKMGKVVTLHLVSEGYTLSYGIAAVRKYFIDNALNTIA